MSSAPVTPPVGVLTADWNWIKAHIALIVLAASLAAGSVYGVESLIARVREADASRADKRYAALTETVDKIRADAAATDQQLLAANAQLLAQNAKLASAITARDQQATKQRAVDASLNAQEAAARLSQQTSTLPSAIKVSGDDLTLPLPVSRIVVSRLDDLATLTADYNDTQKQLAAETQVAANLQKDLDVQKNLVTAQTSLVASCNQKYDQDTKSLKAEARKGKLKWFFIGYVTGFISGKIVKLNPTI